jgi:hypothetical protein
MESREIRFHTGLDIRTAGSTGWPVASPVDGSVRRIRCSARGYGLALYLEDEEGRTLVFAHLDRFFAPAAERLADAQRASGRYEQDLEFPRGEIPVRSGDVIALSGETGTGAPHVHLEVRDAGQRPVNPADFLNLPDRVPPEVLGIRLVPVDPESPLPVEIEPGIASVAARGEWSVEVLAVDRTGTAPFPVAPRSISLYVDGTLHYRLAHDAVAFDQVTEMRLDQRRDERGRWYRMRRRPGMTLPGRTGPGSTVQVGDRPVELFVVVEDAVGLKSEWGVELRPQAVSRGIARPGLHLGGHLLVAEVDGASEMPPLLEGPGSHHLLAEEDGGWRVALPLEGLEDGTWKLLHRGELLVERELRFPAGGIEGGGAVDGPELVAATQDRLFPEGALELKTVEVAGTAELNPVGSGLELISHDFVPARPLDFEGGSGQQHTLLMRFDGRTWSPVTAGKSDAFGIFVFMEDRMPPRIGDLSGSEPVVVQRTAPRSSHGVPLPPWPTMEIQIVDEGTGLPDTGPEVLLDGRPWPVRWDGERDRLILDWFVAPAAGVHELEVRARDRSGGESSRRWRLEFRD